MAMGKNKTGIMAAITAAAETAREPGDGRDRAQRTLPRGTIGSVRAGLGGIQEIDTSQIVSWGPKDRLGVELTAVNTGEASDAVQELAESIREAGQQVPVLLRPSGEKDGHFEVIYGRRRILACRQLGIPVRALIRTLDDAEALMAKGLENSSRTDLSYYERARFAEAILAQGYTRAAVCQALSISKATLSQLERITRLVPTEIGDSVGSAPAAGRPKWMTLAAAFEGDRIDSERAARILATCPEDAASDDRLDALLRETTRRGPRDRNTGDRSPMRGVQIKSGKSTVTLSVSRAGENKAFADWLDRNIDDLVTVSFQRFRSESRGGNDG